MLYVHHSIYNQDYHTAHLIISLIDLMLIVLTTTKFNKLKKIGCFLEGKKIEP